MANRSKQKGTRFERECVKLHTDLEVRAERVPLSGAVEGFKGDIRVYLDSTKFTGECKVGANRFASIYNYIADNDLLFIKRDRDVPLVCMTLEMYKYLLTREGINGKTERSEDSVG